MPDVRGRENLCFDVYPKIVPADREVEITIRPRSGDWAFDEGKAYDVTCFPTEQLIRPGSGPGRHRVRDGALVVTQTFGDEQEHAIFVEDASGEKATPVGEFRVYSLRDDLFARRPWKGDLHVHTRRSDGRDAPAYVPGAGRQAGLDFIAITDHGRYAPSLEAIAAFDGVELDMRLFPGEEVHPPANPIHIVNFGGGVSLSDMFADENAYRSGVEALRPSLGELPAEVDGFAYASCVWCFERIREAGGLGILCHPYWFTRHVYDAPGPFTSVLLERQPYDALEVVGCTREAIRLQVARYHEERAKGRSVPLVGVSDAHGSTPGERFGCCYTMVFSPTPELPDLVASVKELYSVAVEDFPGEAARPHGPFRLVKYAEFLFREVIPAHDELCVEEGRLMIEHAAGDTSAAEALAAVRGRTGRLYDRLWAK